MAAFSGVFLSLSSDTANFLNRGSPASLALPSSLGSLFGIFFSRFFFCCGEHPLYLVCYEASVIIFFLSLSGSEMRKKEREEYFS